MNANCNCYKCDGGGGVGDGNGVGGVSSKIQWSRYLYPIPIPNKIHAHFFW